MNKYIIIAILVSISFLEGQDNQQNSSEYIDMYNEVFERFRDTYVDSINEVEVIKASIKGMLNTVDPYTKFLSGSSKDRLDMLRTGKYGGVGIQIGLRKDTLTVLAPMEDSPAYSEGIYAGDKIYKIDSTLTKGLSVRDASELIRGDLGSVVTLHIYRPYSKEKIKFDLTRANIKLKDVPYWGIDDDNVGYVRIKKFSKNTAKDFRKAIIDFTELGVDGLVIDLRGNSGGLLNNAINMLDVLTDRGMNLLSTKGRMDRANKTIKSRRKPLLSSHVPIVVLINRSTASASEILAGVLQDLDRAVIVGQQSFGKGLVQSMFNLNDTTTIKITTAKYYTPSGRLIQKQDYLDNGFLTDDLDKKDSLFTTLSGREVKGGGGISPDVETEVNRFPPFIQGLWKSGAFLEFASNYVPANDIEAPIIITDDIVNNFKNFLEGYDVNYKLPGEKELEKLKEKISKEEIETDNFLQSIANSLMFWKDSGINSLTHHLDDYFSQERNSQFNNLENIKWIKNGLLREMYRVLEGEKDRIRVSLFEDADYKLAVSILKDLNRYYDILTPVDVSDKEAEVD